MHNQYPTKVVPIIIKMVTVDRWWDHQTQILENVSISQYFMVVDKGKKWVKRKCHFFDFIGEYSIVHRLIP